MAGKVDVGVRAVADRSSTGTQGGDEKEKVVCMGV